MNCQLANFFLLAQILAFVYGGQNLSQTLPVVELTEENTRKLPSPIKDNNETIVILNLIGATIILVQDASHHGYTFRCVGEDVTNFGAIHCDSPQECHHILTCLDDDEHDLEDCSQMGPSRKKNVTKNFVPAESCTEKVEGISCLQFSVIKNNSQPRKSLPSIIVECLTGQNGRGREVYHYTAAQDGKVSIQRIALQMTDESGKKKINFFKARNYPGENKIYSK